MCIWHENPRLKSLFTLHSFSHSWKIEVYAHGSKFACRCANSFRRVVFINPTFCVRSGVYLIQGRFCAYAMVINDGNSKTCVHEAEIRGLIHKMLCRNHPKLILRSSLEYAYCVIHRMNVQTKNVHMRLFQMWNLRIANYLELARN